MNIFQQKRLFILFNEGHPVSINDRHYVDGFVQHIGKIEETGEYVFDSEIWDEKPLREISVHDVNIFQKLDAVALLGELSWTKSKT